MREKGQKGAAVVEFAVVAPLLLLILFGIIEFGILLYDKALITNASREGARAGIVRVPEAQRCADANNLTTALSNEIRGVVNDYCEAHLISFGGGSSPATTTTLIGNTPCGPGASLEVKVDYEFRFLIFSNLVGLFGGNLTDPFDLDAVTVMRME